MSNRSLFTRVELLCGLFRDMPVKLYTSTSNGTILSTDITHCINEGGGKVILSNRRTCSSTDENYNRYFSSDELSRALTMAHNSVGDVNANKIEIRIHIYGIVEDRQVLLDDKELYMVEVDTIRRVIMLTDGSQVIL